MSTACAALDVERIGVRFGGVVALKDVSLSVPAAGRYALIGPNGAGKSTLFNAISGLVPTSSGRIRVNGTDITRRPAHVRASMGVQRTFQSIQLVRSMTVLENVLTGLHAADPHARDPRSRRHDVERAASTAAALGLGDCLYRTADLLSFRQQRYVEVARALVGEPRLVMLDEPAAGLSVAEVDDLAGLLLKMQQARGFAILLVEHVIPLVMQLCTHVTVLDYGRLLASGPGREVMADPEVVRAYLGEELGA